VELETTRRLSYLAPYDWAAALAFLARRAIDGVEQVESGIYRRTIGCNGLTGTIKIAHDRESTALLATIRAPRVIFGVAMERLRCMFDLDADLQAIEAHLARDPVMAPLVAARPGLRVFRGWDVFEVAARSIIGQQVSVEHARRLNGTLVYRCGSDLPDGSDDALGKLFPTARQILDANLAGIGMPAARVATLMAVARTATDNPRLFHRGSSMDETIARLRSVRGIGDWTAHYIAMRACGEPDAFPAGDVGLLRGATDAKGRRPTPSELLARAERWRPWRAYAAHQLWARDEANRRHQEQESGPTAVSS
jgi:AraC family transcriptional regulator of adaptative response / DNA-3-methyladenine glycosylase II